MGGVVLFVLFLICYIIIIKNINIASDNDMRIVVLCMRFCNIVLRQNKAIVRKLFASWTGKIGILINIVLLFLYTAFELHHAHFATFWS